MLHSGYSVNSRCYFGYSVNSRCYFVAQSIAPQFWDKGGLLEKYIRWRTQLCNTLCFWTFVFRPCIWSLLPIHSVRPKAAQLERGPWLYFPAIPVWSSRSVFGSCPFTLVLLFEFSSCINHPTPYHTLPRLTCSWSVLVVSLIRFTGFGASLIQRYVGLHIKPRSSSPRRHHHGGLSDDGPWRFPAGGVTIPFHVKSQGLAHLGSAQILDEDSSSPRRGDYSGWLKPKLRPRPLQEDGLIRHEEFHEDLKATKTGGHCRPSVLNIIVKPRDRNSSPRNGLTHRPGGSWRAGRIVAANLDDLSSSSRILMTWLKPGENICQYGLVVPFLLDPPEYINITSGLKSFSGHYERIGHFYFSNRAFHPILEICPLSML